MIVIPALDLRGGKCIRMEQGDLTTSKVYAEDPVAQAKKFVAEGAKRLHVIDIDAALKHGDNLTVIRDVCSAVDVPVQVGGGIRNADQAQARIEAGAAEIILGSVLVDDERMARNIIGKFGDRVIAGIDVRGTHVATQGWQESTPVDRDSLVKRVALWGIKRVIFTEIRRDGMGGGYDIDALRAVSQAAEIKVTANGGARTLEDIVTLKREAPPAVDMCIVASAVYKGTIKLAEAIAAVA
jgi:phosphoribosylformimino-5-aminoimidazole carboxamide ribotide isomerase